MGLNNSQKAFLILISAGLWEKDARLLHLGKVDYNEVMSLAEEQSVVGLVTAGLEHIVDTSVPKEELLTFIGSTLQIEERNKAMNSFIARLVDKMRKEDVYTLLVKGQGVAQCYERPLWRSAGDVDLYLSNTNYEKAKTLLTPLASELEPEDKGRLHFGMTIDSWLVELHGTMHTGISRRINVVSDEVHQDIFYNGNVRSWNNKGVTIFLPEANDDVIIIFNHFINHFYGEGIGLRQICDWCRLLWSFRSEIDVNLLEKRLKKMGLMKEWRVFGAFAVEYLGLPEAAMPFYENTESYKRKAQKLCELIIESGRLRANSDESYRKTESKIKSNLITFRIRFKEFARLIGLFPINAPRFFVNYVVYRVKAVL